jgi:hypothetical protein
MSLWEYKVITSGKGGFATPALLEKFLNDLGRDEWEIVHFQTPPDNFLAFTGLVRRSTQRDWTLQDAAAAAAKAEADKLRAEFEAKFKAAATNGPGAVEERAPSFLEEKVAPDDGFRKPVDTSRDDDPESADDDKDDWDKLTAAEEDELPTFFDAIKPHMRRNQRGPGMSVGVDYLAKKWEQPEEDMKGALEECGFVMPTDEDSKVEYLEYDGDLYWLNINRRGELWINTKEKPRPVFRPVKAQRVIVEETPKPPQREQKQESGGRSAGPAESAEAPERKDESAPGSDTAATPAPAPAPAQNKQQGTPVALPEGMALLDKVRPHMRRNRRGPGGSGSTSFLARALRSNEADLKAAFVALGMTLPTGAADKPVYTEFGNELWWLNIDSRGGLWINGREKRAGETAGTASEETSAPATTGEPAAATEAASTAEAAVASDSTSTGVAAEGDAPVPTSASEPTAESGAEPVISAPASASTDEAGATPALVADKARESSDAAQAATENAREMAPVAAESAGSEDPVQEPDAIPETVAPAGATVLTGIRVFLKETRTGAAASKIDRIATELGQSPEDVLATLVIAGLKVPEKPREKHVFVQHAGEIFWLNKNARGELWLNAKAAKLGAKDESDNDAGEGGDSVEPAAEGVEGEADKKSGRRPASRPRPKKME